MNSCSDTVNGSLFNEICLKDFKLFLRLMQLFTVYIVLRFLCEARGNVYVNISKTHDISTSWASLKIGTGGQNIMH